MASTIVSTWSPNVIAERSSSLDACPGSVIAVTSWPSARSFAATSSHAHAPSQKPGTRMIGALAMVLGSSLFEVGQLPGRADGSGAR